MPRGRPKKNMACLDTSKVKTDEEIKAEILKKYNEVQKGSKPTTLEDQLNECVVVENPPDSHQCQSVAEDVDMPESSNEIQVEHDVEKKVLDIETPEECYGFGSDDIVHNDICPNMTSLGKRKSESSTDAKLPFVDANSSVAKENEKLKETVRSLTEEISELKAKLEMIRKENEDVVLKLAKSDFDRANYREQLNNLIAKMKTIKTDTTRTNRSVSNKSNNGLRRGMNGYESWN